MFGVCARGLLKETMQSNDLILIIIYRYEYENLKSPEITQWLYTIQ